MNDLEEPSFRSVIRNLTPTISWVLILCVKTTINSLIGNL